MEEKNVFTGKTVDEALEKGLLNSLFANLTVTTLLIISVDISPYSVLTIIYIENAALYINENKPNIIGIIIIIHLLVLAALPSTL